MINKMKYGGSVLKNCVTQLDEFLDQLIKMPNRDEYAVVFDVDDTLISTIRMPDGGLKSVPIYGMQKIYKKVQKARFQIYIITARKEIIRQETEKDLHDLGFTGYNKMYMRETKIPNVPPPPEQCFCFNKERARADIEVNYGHKVILNIFDQRTDALGGFFVHGWKLPHRYNGDCKHVKQD